MCVAIRRIIRDEHDVALYTRGALFLEELRSGANFDLVLLDMSMPQLTGFDVNDAAARISPATAERIVFMSGSSNLGATVRGRPLLAKPFGRAELLDLVATKLEAPSRVC